MRKLSSIVAVLLAGCSGEQSSTLYTGALQPLSGTCDPSARAQLIIRRNAVIFLPNSGTLVLSGASAAGSLTALYTAVGPEGKHLLKFEGSLKGSKINGIYQDVRCRYAVTLQHTQF